MGLTHKAKLSEGEIIVGQYFVLAQTILSKQENFAPKIHTLQSQSLQILNKHHNVTTKGTHSVGDSNKVRLRVIGRNLPNESQATLYFGMFKGSK